jgi:MFS family permease
MVPVGRLVVLRSVPRNEIVGAMALIAMPALLGPVLGPPLGGFITTYAGWHWIFWINIPIAAAGIVLSIAYIPQIRETAASSFDWLGFALVGPGLAAVLGAVSLLGLDYGTGSAVYVLFVAGVLLLAAYVRHALTHENALIDLKLLRIPTFQKGISGGFLFRVGVGATPFLLPLLLQTALGMTAFQSGLTTFVTGAGALTMKLVAPRIITRFGFRQVLLKNAIFAAIFAGAPILFLMGVPIPIMMALLFIGGLSRSLEFTSVNAVVYADIAQEHLSRASTFSAVLQELSGSVGIAIAAITLQTSQVFLGGNELAPDHFVCAFALITLISLAAAIPFSKLPTDAGGSLTRRMPSPGSASTPSPAEAD